MQATSTLQATHEPVLPTPAGPWRRFFARMFDVYVSIILLGIVGEYTLGRYSSRYVEFMATPNNELLIGVLFLPFALALDALVSHLFGNNLGKYLLGVKVVKIKGKMDLNDWLSRAFNVWKSGMAFGIPLVSLWTTIRENKRVGMMQPTTYDQRCGFQVYGRTLSVGHKLVALVSVIAVYAVVIGLNVLSKQIDQEAVKVSISPSYSWQNPTTRIEASVSADWNHETKDNGSGVDVNTFTERTERALVIFGVESGEVSLNEYVLLFQKGTKDNMAFADGGRYFDIDGAPTWVGQGSMKSDVSTRLRVEVRKNGKNFWRIVTIQARPFDFSDLKVQALSTSLWKSITFDANPVTKVKEV